MCLTSKWRFPKRAKKDIVCYKVLERDDEGKLRTPYIDTYINNISTPFIAKGISLSFDNKYEKGKGYIHTFTKLSFLELEYSTTLTFRFIFHPPVVFKCIIPKGTKYHTSTDGKEYCSKKIIFKEKITKYEICKS